MSIYKKAKEILFEKDLLAFVKSDQTQEAAQQNKKGEEHYKGAWKEDGNTRWSVFIAEDGDQSSIIKEEKSIETVEPQKPLEEKSEPIKDTRTKVFFVEDNKSVHLAIKSFINSYKEIKFIGSASNGKEAVEKIKNMDIFPDIILMDIAMPQMDGLEATKAILTFNPSIKIIMLTAYGTKQHIVDAFAAGAIGYIRKDGGLGLIREAINQAARGGVVPIQDEIAACLLEGTEPGFMEDQVMGDEIKLLDTTEEEEVEMTEEEFIEELTLEILEEILSVDAIENYDEHLRDLLESNKLSEVAGKYILQFEDDTFSKETSKEYLTEKLTKNLEEALIKERARLK